MEHKLAALHVYGYKDGVETCLGTVWVDMAMSECKEYLHLLVKEQLQAFLEGFEEVCFMDNLLHDLRELYQNGSSLEDLFTRAGYDCPGDEKELFTLMECDGHCVDYIKLCVIGTDDEYAEEDRGFWEC